MDYASTTDEMIRRIGTIQDEVGAGACFGTPVERDGRTIIPVARVSFGYGLGFGGGSGSGTGKGIPSEFGVSEMEGGEGGGGGGGGGGSSSPVAVVEITDSGVEVRPISDPTRIAMSSFLFAAWAVFWVTLTVRTIARETGRTKREHAKA